MTSPIEWEEDEHFNNCHWGLVDGRLKYDVVKGGPASRWSCVVENVGEFAKADTLEEAKRRCEEHLEGVR
jgi:hypothetical protein